MSVHPPAAQPGRVLAPWASDPRRSRGRRFDEGSAAPRSEHQRDRDRIVHSNAFRRLVYKTQVFVNHEGDLFRTRLTHSLEVAQLARSAARLLALNEDLVEAIALAHDLGHTPFGHAGQDALNACMAAHGGFEHNLQSLRVVDRLEQRYPGFDGLNLTHETRVGILKHCSAANARRLAALEPEGPAQRFILGQRPHLEAQLVNLADELAYNAHDIDDGVRSGLLQLAQLRELPLFARFHDAVLADYPGLARPEGERRLLAETLRRLLSSTLFDLVETTAARLREHGVRDAGEVPALPPLVALSPGFREQADALKRYLFRALYRHEQVVCTTARARRVVEELFGAYCADPSLLPAEHAGKALEPGAGGGPRAVADYIAGMTDRFALREHHRISGQRLFDDDELALAGPAV